MVELPPTEIMVKNKVLTKNAKKTKIFNKNLYCVLKFFPMMGVIYTILSIEMTPNM